MDKKNYQKPSMKVVKMKMSHIICQSLGSGSSYARGNRGPVEWDNEE